MVDKKSDKNTEERILDAAIKIFCRDGIQGARMQDIADLANINRAMLHYYFRDRESLSEEAVAKTTIRFHRDIRNQIDSDLPFDEKLDGYIKTQIKIYSEDTDMVIFSLHESLKDSDFLGKIYKNSVDDLGFLKEVKNEIKKGRIRPFKEREFLIFTTSLCAFPFVAATIYKMIFGWTDEQWKPFLEQYKKQLPDLIKQAVYTDYRKQ
jgi:AcrR family transcriptional regulator